MLDDTRERRLRTATWARPTLVNATTPTSVAVTASVGKPSMKMRPISASSRIGRCT